MKIVIVIPAYNEEKSIGKVVRDLKKGGYHDIVVVDDGSRDRTSEIAKNKGAIVLRHVINRGQGAALKTGIDAALDEDADVIVTFDADGQHQVSDINALVTPVEKGKCDISLGSRFLHKKSNTPFLKIIALKAGAVFNWIFYGVRLTDAHNGFRVLSRKAAVCMDITADKMEHASEILDEIKKNNLKYIEVPVTIKYTDYSLGKGQSAWKSIPLGFKLMFRKIVKLLK